MLSFLTIYELIVVYLPYHITDQLGLERRLESRLARKNGNFINHDQTLTL